MEQECPRCSNITQGEAPNKPHYIVFICDVCGCSWDEDGNILHESDTVKKPEKKEVNCLKCPRGIGECTAICTDYKTRCQNDTIEEYDKFHEQEIGKLLDILIGKAKQVKEIQAKFDTLPNKEGIFELISCMEIVHDDKAGEIAEAIHKRIKGCL